MSEKAVLYVRVSSEEQETNTSLDSQEKTGRQYAEKNSLEIVKLWRGPESAWRNDSKDDSDRIRKNFNEMLDYVATNKIKNLIFDVPDRMTRNEDDKIRIRKLIKQDGITVHFARTNKKLHKYSDSDDYFMFGIEVLMAEKYSSDLSKRIRKGMDATVEKGQFPAIAPIGYLNNAITKVLDIDPVRAPLVKLAFELKAQNKTVDEIVEILFQRGLRSRKLGTKFPGNMKVVSSRMHKLLRDPFYYGEFHWNGGFYKGAHKPLISKELWQRAQDAFDTRIRAPHTLNFPFNGLVKCGLCGCSVIGGAYKKKRYHYYRCSFGRGRHENALYLKPETLCSMFEKHLKGLSLPNEAFKFLKTHLEKNTDASLQTKSEMLLRLEADRKTLSDRMSKLYDDKLDGKISEAFWANKNAEYQSHIGDIEKQIEGFQPSKPFHLAEGLFIIELVKDIVSIYLSLSEEKKGGFLRFLSLNSLLHAETLEIKLKKPFSFFLNLQTKKWWRRWDLNPRPNRFR
jgi:site-specific DNA recombinase